jgi:cytochrome P450
MSETGALQLEPARLRELFDLSGDVYATRGGSFDVDPYPVFNALRESGPVHEGIPGPMVGFHGEAVFEGLPFPDRPHYTAFDYETCDLVLRDTDRFTPSAYAPGTEEYLYETTMLYMEGERHRRYRTLVQPSFVPKRAQWWIDQWIRTTVHALIDNLEAKVTAGQGSADLNVEFCAPIPLLTICGSFGVTVQDALDIRAAVTSDGVGLERFIAIVMPIIAARRVEPRDDLISVLVQAELNEADGTRHVLSDHEVLGFAFLLLAAGSGTTWKQMGITLLALLQHPEWLARVRDDPTMLRAVIEESLRWMPTDPVFARFAAKDVTLHGVDIAAGSVVHVCLASANRDPKRWERPDEFDPGRPLQSHLGFGSGPHICLGMHVARAEIHTGVGALVERLPNLRLDIDAAPVPRIIGMYERGPSAVPVLFG